MCNSALGGFRFGLGVAMIMAGLAALPASATPIIIDANGDSLQYSFTGLPTVSGATDQIALTSSNLGSGSATFNAGADQVTVSMSGYDAQIVQGTLPNYYQAPVTGGTQANPTYLTTPYFSTGWGNVLLNFSQQQSYLEFLWGAVGVGDTIEFFNTATNGNKPIASLTGNQLISDVGVNTMNGSQGLGGSAYVLFNFAAGLTFNQVELLQTYAPSFEAGDFVYAAQKVSVPEPSTLAILGFAVLAIAFLRRRANGADLSLS